MNKSVAIVVGALVVVGLLIGAVAILRSRQQSTPPSAGPSPSPAASSAADVSSSTPIVMSGPDDHPWCGDGVCNGDEISRLCPRDCGAEITTKITTSEVGTDFLVLKWETQLPTTVTVRYGTSPDSVEGSVDSATLGTSHEVRLSNLQARTTYHISLTVREADGTETEITDYAFETLEE